MRERCLHRALRARDSRAPEPPAVIARNQEYIPCEHDDAKPPELDGQRELPMKNRAKRSV
jgi:hypothetical protein